MYKIPFILGNLLACLVPGRERRKLTRAYTNRVLFYPFICRFIRRRFGERVHSIKFVRQVTLGRVVFLVNNNYFVKVFRDVSNARLKDQEFLVNYAMGEFAHSKCANIVITPFFAAANAPMYACVRVPGKHLREFPPEKILANKEKIENQVMEIIDVLQSIDVNKIPGKERFLSAMQSRTAEKPSTAGHQVLAHFDLNRTNCLFDDDLNVCAVIDWDGLSIAENPDTDRDIFMKNWNGFIEKQRTMLNAQK